MDIEKLNLNISGFEGPLDLLLELSKRIKIFAGTSPSPEPGGTGLAITD